jgi:ankyrin repeat protein
MGIVKKFKQKSKTIEKIVDWLIEFKSLKIISTLIDCLILSDHHRYKIIFLTQEFNLLERDFLRRYVLKRTGNDVPANKKSNDKEKYSVNKNTPNITSNNVSLVDKSKNKHNQQYDFSDENSQNSQKIDIVTNAIQSDGSDNEEKTNITKHEQDQKQNIIEESNNDQLDNNQLDNENNDPLTQKINSENTDNYHELDAHHQQMILNILPLIIEKSLTRSFYMVLKLCPYILESADVKTLYTNVDLKNKKETKLNKTQNLTKTGGNILHTLNNDNSVDILEIILKKNRNLIDEKDDQGRTPLILFAELGLGKCVQKLIDYAADYEIVDIYSDTFLHKLCANGKLDIVQNIIRKIIDIIDVKNDKLMTPALIAAANKHEEIFYILKGLNANLDEVDIYGNTVYHYICESKICPGILVVNKKNKFGFTPYDYCKIYHNFYYFQK